MLDNETKKRIDDARDILVGKVPDPKSQVEQITIALIYKFMDDMDLTSEEFGGKRQFFAGDYQRYAWRNLMDPAFGGHEMLSIYSEAIQRLNTNPGMPQLFRDIFKNAYLPYRDPQTLRDFLKVINGFNYDHSEKLGDAFEYLLSVLGSQGDAGQFRTPRHIIDFMVYITDPKKHETVLDPACGTAGFLISSYKHILRNNSSGFDPANDLPVFGNGDGKQFRGDLLTPAERVTLVKNFRGYDISPDMVRLSLVNLYLHGFAEPRISEYDTLTSDERWNEHSDVILANPPFMSPRGGIRPHSRFSVSSNRSEVLFVDYIAEHLTPGGRAAVIVPEGIIFQSGNAYKALRKMLVEKYLYAVVSLPAGVFNPYSGVKTSILLMDTRLASRTDSILFVKIESDGYDLGAQRRPVEKNDLTHAAKCLKAYTTALLSNTPFEPADYMSILLAKKEDIASNGDYNLSGERYKASDSKCNSNFELVELRSIVDFVSGYAFKSSDLFDTYRERSIPVIKIGDFQDGKISLNNVQFHEYSPQLSKFLIKENDVLIAMTGATVGKTAIAGKINAMLNQRVGLVRSKTPKLDQSFLNQIIRSELFYRYCQQNAGGGAQGNISPNEIQNYIIPLPPLEVQKEIVTQIDSWQKIIDGARQIIDNYKPHIDIDPSWPMVELGEVCEVRGGKRIPKGLSFSNEETSHPYIRVTDFRDYGIDTNNLKFISDEIFNLISNYTITSEDVYISIAGTIGLSGVVPDSLNNANLTENAAKIKIKDNAFHKNFLAFILGSDLILTQVKKLTHAVGVPKLALERIKKIRVPFPPYQVQQYIVENIMKEREIISQQHILLSLFTGKINKRIDDIYSQPE